MLYLAAPDLPAHHPFLCFPPQALLYLRYSRTFSRSRQSSVLGSPSLSPDHRLQWSFPTPRIPDSDDSDDGLAAAKLRAIVTSTVNTEVQPRLWSSSDGTVSFDDTVREYQSNSPFETKSQNTLANISTITGPLWPSSPPVPTLTYYDSSLLASTRRPHGRTTQLPCLQKTATHRDMYTGKHVKIAVEKPKLPTRHQRRVVFQDELLGRLRGGAL